MRVRSVRARGVDVPLRKPVETARGTLRTAPAVLIDVFTDEGITGRAYVSVYTQLVLGPLTRLIHDLAGLLQSTEADPALAGVRLDREFALLGRTGLVGIALAAIDMALWDVQAKAAGQPLAVLLGGPLAPVPAYASLSSMSPLAVGIEAQDAVDLGFTAVKVKLGRGGLADDLELVRAVREAIGADAELMVDYNQALPVDEAIRRGRRLDAEGLAWIEEPTRSDDFAGHARIAAELRTPIQLGENWWGVSDLENGIAARSSSHVMFDAMRIGGVSGWRRAAERAQAAGLPVSSHGLPEISAHLLAATPAAHRLEFADKFGPILTQPIQVADGHVLVSDRPGCGLEWDEQALRRLTD